MVVWSFVMPLARLVSRSLRLGRGGKLRGANQTWWFLQQTETNMRQSESLLLLLASGKPAIIVSRSPHQMPHELVRVTVSPGREGTRCWQKRQVIVC